MRSLDPVLALTIHNLLQKVFLHEKRCSNIKLWISDYAEILRSLEDHQEVVAAGLRCKFYV